MITTIKIDSNKRDKLKIIATLEKRNLKSIIDELIDDYLERYTETLEILSHPDWMKAIEKGLQESKKGKTVKWQRMKK
ncbi:MAG: hypothetical protein A2Y62_16670 [Candidatus Fischerbacteria bacterium RBG_13_37_8]|uniref:CopG family transcriptional regulator n=1 Tax=Candidatus Fischerbacteria bacterium RBG_13_37_8 TaxID=1817863 RepID=A0A1F5VP20_9BACT|nr:MAG: hypothetical protein A2Y62_16670 [Candidatus Fischerbacteria bacterium RBG_13_37_8]